MKIEIEIFDDGQEPVTCARDFRNKLFCQFLCTSKFGSKFHCKLFGESDGSDRIFNYHSDEGYLKPHEKCLEMRKQIKEKKEV